MRQYLLNLWAASSQLLNVSLFNGSPRETLSSRCFREPWPVGLKLVNSIIFWQVNHCRSAFTTTLKWAKEFSQNKEVA